MEQLREVTVAQAMARAKLAERWREALTSGRQLVEAIRPPAERYYEQKDPLTLHYRESVDRHVEARYRLRLVHLQVANMAGLLAPTTFLPLGTLTVAVAGAAYFLPRMLRLRREALPLLQRADRHPAFVNELNLTPHWVYPLLFSALLLWVSGLAPLLFWAAYFGGLAAVAVLRPEVRCHEAARRHTLLADTRARLLAYGKALVDTLSAGEHFHATTPAQLALEEEAGEQYLYLSDAEHHDHQLFARALATSKSTDELARREQRWR